MGRICTKYASVYGGFGYGIRNTDGSTVLEFADSLGLVICRRFFMKQDSQLVSCESSLNKSTVVCVLVKNPDKKGGSDCSVFPY